MDKGENGNPAERPPIDFEAWGKSVAEEVLFRAGLDMSDASAEASTEASKVQASLEFQITANEAERSLALEFERVAGAPIKLHIPLGN